MDKVLKCKTRKIRDRDKMELLGAKLLKKNNDKSHMGKNIK